VWRERRFTPGIIHLGNDASPVVRHCRYQDATSKFDQSHGWGVNIERSGQYEITLRAADVAGPGQVVVNWQGREFSQPVSPEQPRAVLALPAGQGTVEIEFVPQATAAEPVGGKNVRGDVDVRFVAAVAVRPSPAKSKAKAKRD
jgi:hypothetical protein